MAKISEKLQLAKKKLRSLNKEKKNLILSISDISDKYNSQAVVGDKADSLLEGLPVKNLNDSLAKDYGKPIILGLQLMKSRSSLRKEILKKQSELEQIDDVIFVAKIDVVLEKIKVALAS